MQIPAPRFGARHYIPMDKDVVSAFARDHHEGGNYSGFVQGAGVVLLTDDWATLGHKLSPEQMEELKQALEGKTLPAQDSFEFRSALQLVEKLSGKSDISHRRAPTEPRGSDYVYLNYKGYPVLERSSYDRAVKRYEEALRQFREEQEASQAKLEPAFNRAAHAVRNYFASRTGGWL